MNRFLRLITFLAAICLSAGASLAQTAGFNASVTSGCAPLLVQFTSTSTGATSYYWTLNSGASVPTNNPSPSTTYLSPGTYTVTLHINSPNGPSATKTITVYPGPTVNFSASPSAGCPPLTVNFSSTVTANAPGSLSYTWNYGDGTISTTAGANPTHTYNNISGALTVTLAVKNGAGCTTTLPLSAVNVYPKPSAAFTTSTSTLCKVPSTATFISAGASGVSYNWTFSGGSPSSSSNPNPTVTFNTAGSYSATLLAVNSQGCKDTVTKNNYINVYANNAAFSAPDSACDSTYVPFVNTTSGVTGGTFWDFGDGNIDTGISMSHYYTAAGTYTVTMVTRVGSCWDTVMKAITINPKPIISITHDRPCMPGTMTFSVNTTTPLSTYAWKWASGGSAVGNPVTHSYTAPGIDTVYLIAGTGSGCADTTSRYIYVQDWYPRVTYTEGGCVPFTASFHVDPRPCSHVPTDTIIGDTPCYCPPPIPCYEFPFTSYTWWVDNVLTSTSASFSTTFTTVGPHMVVLKSVTANGCQRYDTFYTCAANKVPPSFYAYPDTVVCVNTPVYFQNTTGDTTIAYAWYYGSGELDTNNGDYNGYHKYRYPKSDTVMLISTVCGCSDTLIRPNYITVRPADAHFSISPECPPSKTVHFTNTSVGDSTDFWDFGNGDTSTLRNPPPITYPDTGLYMVKHIAWNSVYGCRDTVIDSVRIWPFLIGLAADTTICTGDTMKLVGSFSGLPSRTYEWWTGGHQILRWPMPSTSFDSVMPNRGYYQFTWIVRSSSNDQVCVNSISRTVLVSHPEADFRISQKIGCTPDLVVFLDSTSYTPGTQPAWREWIFGDGSNTANNNSSSAHTYTAAGKYGVRLKVTDWIGCTDSLWKIDSVEARHPVAAFTMTNASGCVGAAMKFYNNSHGATRLHYQWNFGDSSTSTLDSPSHVYQKAGSYAITLIATDSTGCSDTLIKSGFVNITKPTAGFTISDTLTVCPPLIVNFMNTSTNATAYNWDFKNGNTSALAYPATTFINPGMYDVRLVAADANGCTDTAWGRVRILGYAGALQYSPVNGCVPLTVNFTALLTNAPKIVWDFSNGDTALMRGSTTSYTYTTPGKYVPRLIFYDDKGCSASSTGLDTIKVDDVTAGFRVLPPCEKTPLQLVDSSHSLFTSMKSWSWDFGNGQIATGNPVTRIYSSAGRYPVTLIATDAWGCSDTLTDSFTIYPLPVITARADTAVCIPDAVPLWAMGGVSYAWTPPGSLSCANCDTPAASPKVPTAYIVTGTDARGCANKDTVRIGIQAKTTFTVVSDGEICLGDAFQLSASGATVYHWTPSESLSNADSAGPLAHPKVTTTYIATGYEGSCLADTHMVKVVVNPLPTIDAGQDERMVAGGSVQLQASGSGLSHVEWTADSALSCTDCYAPYASPYKTTTFYVTGYTSKGCKALDSVLVRVLCDQSQLFIPNTFTPNGDGLNDYFFPRGRGVDVLKSFRVYSRWGELLFQRDNMAVNDEFNGWNGTYQGRKLAPDVYVYVIEGACASGEPMVWKGDVTLLR